MWFHIRVIEKGQLSLLVKFVFSDARRLSQFLLTSEVCVRHAADACDIGRVVVTTKVAVSVAIYLQKSLRTQPVDVQSMGRLKSRQICDFVLCSAVAIAIEEKPVISLTTGEYVLGVIVVHCQIR